MKVKQIRCKCSIFFSADIREVLFFKTLHFREKCIKRMSDRWCNLCHFLSTQAVVNRDLNIHPIVRHSHRHVKHFNTLTFGLFTRMRRLNCWPRSSTISKRQTAAWSECWNDRDKKTVIVVNDYQFVGSWRKLDSKDLSCPSISGNRGIRMTDAVCPQLFLHTLKPSLWRIFL